MKEKKKKPYEIGELDQYLFGQGTHYEIYKKLGAHLVDNGKEKGVYFAVWAPHAKAVSVIGEFNDWDIQANPMQILAAGLSLLYKYRPGRNNDINTETF